MFFNKEIEQYLTLIEVLQKSFRETQDKDIFPLSFFSESLEILNKLKSGLFELELVQFRMMAEHLKETEEKLNDTYEPPLKEQPEIVEVKQAVIVPEKTEEQTPQPIQAPSQPGFFGDKIVKKIFPDFNKSLNLNQRFMFQRELFGGNVTEMNKALTRLDTFQTMDEVFSYLNSYYQIKWESDSGIVFKELLEKRFV
jgi:hypothetical protein